MRPPSELIGIGIDLISWSRIERFLAQHSFEFINRLLTPSEQEAFQRVLSPVEFFAQCFTAKEAYFKAFGGDGMGEAEFRRIETRMEGDGRFRITSDFLQPQGAFETQGRFFEVPNGMGAEVFIWRERTT